ncbi:hypothetical protein M569_16548, partial [Genlisea aurea]
LRTIKIETDCLTLVCAINENIMLNASLLNTLTDIKVLLMTFDSCVVCFIRRQANNAAHLLAK